MAIYLGIDGGGTKTTCVVADETSVLGSATTGGSNITRHGDARVREALRSAVKTACAAAKVDPSQIESACVGPSGAGRPEVRDAVAGMMRELLRARIVVLSDLETTLQAAFGDSLGVITIAGTGSIAYGRDAQGQTARAGGWGLAISDEGSGQWIGRTAVSAVLGAKDAGDDPPLLATILKLWKLTSLDELVRRANASPPPDFSSLVRVVLAAAEAGDPLAKHVLYQAGTELAAIAGNVIRRLFADGCSVPVAMSGGVFRQSEVVREVFSHELSAEFPQASIQPVVVDPVRGALELARKAIADKR
ncbi:MAG TPA: BadF/BadG/BcrA/BcrD ATPase family protein [Bryobacteraceae bacterium]|nr:BadF/BadG/BcrA/BcrD ATPase family protein [Bryobacteraceae bacterium]